MARQSQRKNRFRVVLDASESTANATNGDCKVQYAFRRLGPSVVKSVSSKTLIFVVATWLITETGTTLVAVISVTYMGHARSAHGG